MSFNAGGCTVERGHWNDPYTARVHTRASDIQIDHLVALKNAYMTGAHEWDFKKRCLYANYMGNSFHLLSVNGKENLKKSDHSPASYVPPNRAYTCSFLKQWLSVKLIWSLRLTPQEKTAITTLVKKNGCETDEFRMSTTDLSAQRTYMNDHADLCAGVDSGLERF